MAEHDMKSIERDHQETWNAFVKGSTWITAFVIAVLALMALFLI